MTANPKQRIHTFLVSIFHNVLRLETASLRRSGLTDLSVSELHLLQAAKALGDDCSMGRLALRLTLSAGSVTTAVNALVRKGYLTRAHCDRDRRRVLITTTPKAEAALETHQHFYEKLVTAVTATLTEPEVEALADTLETLHQFFTELS